MPVPAEGRTSNGQAARYPRSKGQSIRTEGLICFRQVCGNTSYATLLHIPKKGAVPPTVRDSVLYVLLALSDQTVVANDRTTFSHLVFPAPSCPTKTTLTLLRLIRQGSEYRSSKYTLMSFGPLTTIDSGGSAQGLPPSSSVRAPFKTRSNRRSWLGTGLPTA